MHSAGNKQCSADISNAFFRRPNACCCQCLHCNPATNVHNHQQAPCTAVPRTLPLTHCLHPRHGARAGPKQDTCSSLNLCASLGSHASRLLACCRCAWFPRPACQPVDVGQDLCRHRATQLTHLQSNTQATTGHKQPISGDHHAENMLPQHSCCARFGHKHRHPSFAINMRVRHR